MRMMVTFKKEPSMTRLKLWTLLSQRDSEYPERVADLLRNWADMPTSVGITPGVVQFPVFNANTEKYVACILYDPNSLVTNSAAETADRQRIMQLPENRSRRIIVIERSDQNANDGNKITLYFNTQAFSQVTDTRTITAELLHETAKKVLELKAKGMEVYVKCLGIHSNSIRFIVSDKPTEAEERVESGITYKSNFRSDQKPVTKRLKIVGLRRDTQSNNNSNNNNNNN